MKKRPTRQQGYFLVLAVIFIMIMGVLGSLIAYNQSEQASISADQYHGLQAFYLAESGLEIATRYLNRPGIIATPSRIACGSVAGYSQLTNATLGDGTFTATTVNSSPVFATSLLASGVSASATSITANSTSGFAPTGTLTIDMEVMNYAAISGNAFIGVTRGVAGTSALSHASGAGIGQYQCSLNVQAGIPSIASPKYWRQLERNVHLQYGWAIADAQSNNFTVINWNRSSELNWTSSLVSGGSSAANLNAISMLSEADGWAVADRAASSFIFLRWNGSSWVLNAISGSCSGQHLLGVSMTSSAEGYAVGARYRPDCGSGQRRYTVMRWNGSVWSLLTPTSSPSIPADNNSNQNLNAVHVVDTSGNGYANLGFTVGDSCTILRYNGSTWTADTCPGNKDLLGVFTVSASEAWAVGATGTILRWNGSSWSSFSSPVTSNIQSIAMYDSNGDGLADFGIAAGNSGRVLVYNGSSWSAVDLGSQTLYAVDLFNENDAWVGGASGTLYHWDGNTWTNFTSGTSKAINAIGLVHAGNKVTSIWRQIFH